MSNFFSKLTRYAGNWTVIAEDKLDAEDFAALKPTAVIVKSTWGKSFCFTPKVGNYQMYIPADSTVESPIGSAVPLTDLTILTLHKEGETDIQRVKYTPSMSY